MSVNRHFDSMLFNYETTNRNDFQYNNITPAPKTVYQEKPRSKRPGSPQKYYIHTLTKWKISKIPTELYVKRKEIVRTNPKDIEMQSQEPVNEIKISDKDRQKVQATRPRLVMTPAVSMDDIDNSEVRGLLINDIYQSSVQKMQEEMRNSWRDHSYRAPLNGQLTCAQPITLQKLQMPYVSPEWRMDSISWDNRQVRAYCDPCKEFYLSREPKCSACDFTAARESQKAKKTQ